MNRPLGLEPAPGSQWHDCALAYGLLLRHPLQPFVPMKFASSFAASAATEGRGSTALNRIDNHLIERLPREDRRPPPGPVCLRRPRALAGACHSGRNRRPRLFSSRDFVSLLTVVSGEVGLEVGMVGREGMLGAHLALGVDAAPLHALVQGPGSAWRLEAPAFISELRRSAALQREVDLYASSGPFRKEPADVMRVAPAAQPGTPIRSNQRRDK